MRNLIDRIEQLWCETMHTATMWPIHGHYRCGTCLREYPVGFEAVEERPSSASLASWASLTSPAP